MAGRESQLQGALRKSAFIRVNLRLGSRLDPPREKSDSLSPTRRVRRGDIVSGFARRGHAAEVFCRPAAGREDRGSHPRRPFPRALLRPFPSDAAGPLAARAGGRHLRRGAAAVRAVCRGSVDAEIRVGLRFTQWFRFELSILTIRASCGSMQTLARLFLPLLTLLALALPLPAQIPQLINYQGRVAASGANGPARK